MGEGAAAWVRRLLVATAVALAALFVLLAATRRLNFDESLALRAGRLECLGAGAEPPFVMPATLLFGALSLVVDDPGLVFLLLRLGVAAAVLAALLSLLRASRLSTSRCALAVAVLLAMAAFATHGLEFRYDAAILVGLMLAVAAMARGTAGGVSAAAAALAFVALHQTKGALLAAVLLPVVAVLNRRVPRLGRSLLVGVAAMLAPWLLLLAARGLTSRWIATYLVFARLGADAPRTALATAIGRTMLRDLAWWSVAALALLTLLRASAGGERTRFDRAILAAIFATLGIALLHPHPWPYMLALPAPFLALVVARRWPAASDRRGQLLWLGVGVAAMLLQAAIGRGLPFDAHRLALKAPRATEVRLLRELRARAEPGDAVLDPTGLVYFLSPCTQQWYIDGLFVEAARRGEWMTELAQGVPANCTWAVNSYRLVALPPNAQHGLAVDYRPAFGALALRRGVTRTLPSAAERGMPLQVENYW
jgi:hypothetical protein